MMSDECDAEGDTECLTEIPCDRYVIGVGASAGGLEALEKFFDAVPDAPDVTFVVIQHLSPDYRSHMVDLLGRRTSLKIRIVEDQMSMDNNTIYLIPPGKTLIVSQNKFLLTDKDKSSVTYPIDTFFRSLASEVQKSAIGVILSGTGSDGSRGITDISEAGGLVLAQDTESAAFDGMPSSAVETGVVNLVLRPEEMPVAILKYIDENLSPDNLKMNPPPLIDADALETIFKELSKEFGIDFNQYKPNTILRRIQRRVEATGSASIEEYSDRIAASKEEVHALYRDLLIDVTHFFRDPDAFKKLSREVLEPMVEQEDEKIRVWVAGCATGEEAYTVAILLTEAAEKLGVRPNFKVFGSDAHSDSVRRASEGIYGETSMKNVTPEIREKYFIEREEQFAVQPSLRKNVVFTQHNIVKDVPFTKLHLITCRNLLIYLQTAAQKRIFSYFHFGLRTRGVLMLGPSESLGELAEEFDPVDKHWKIYRKRRDVRLLSGPRNFGEYESAGLISKRNQSIVNGPGELAATSEHGRRERRMTKVYDSLLGDFMPPGMIVDDSSALLHLFPGGERFVSLRHGKSSHDLSSLLKEDVRASVMAALQQSIRENSEIIYQSLSLEDDQGEVTFDLRTRPVLSEDRHLGAYLITFTQTNLPPADEEEEAMGETPIYRKPSRIGDLEMQLRFAKENLQATIEELETGNEELQATNEELVASNEELQSSNEELHSVNEELDTVNSELQAKIVELTELTEDIDNMLASTEIGVLFLDSELHVRKVTPILGEILGLGPRDMGRRLPNLTAELGTNDLHEDLLTVIEGEDFIEREFEIESGKRYLLRITPYQSESREDGLVLAVFDITSMRETEHRATELASIISSSNDAIIGFSFSGIITAWNQGAEQIYGFTAAEAEGQNALGLIVPPEEAGNFMTELDHARKGEPMETQTMRRRTKLGHDVMVTFRLSTATTDDSAETQIASVERDVTDEMHLRHDRDRLAQVIENTSNFVGICEDDGKILFINKAGRELLGYSEEDDFKKESIAIFHEPEDYEWMKAKALPYAVEHGMWKGRNRLRHKDGSLLSVSQVIVRQKGRDGSNDHFSTIISDLTPIEKAYDRLEKLETRSKETADTLRAVIEGFPEMLIVTDAAGKTTYASQAAEIFLKKHTRGGELPLGLDRLISLALETGKDHLPESSEGVVAFAIPSQAPKYYLPRVSVMKEDRQVIGLAITLQDVTEFRMLEDVKTDLIGAVGHELKNPVAGISLNLGLILEGAFGDLDPQLVKTVELASEETERISATIGSLLNLTRFESGRERLDAEDVKVAELIDSSVAANRLTATKKKVVLKTEIENSGMLVYCDVDRILIVLNNLVTNAIKHSPQGSEILVRAEEKRSFLQISVIDSGPGVPEDLREKVFDKFYKVSDNKLPGSGLGLNIAREFVEAHHGTIGVRAGETGGAEFFFCIPLTQPRLG